MAQRGSEASSGTPVRRTTNSRVRVRSSDFGGSLDETLEMKRSGNGAPAGDHQGLSFEGCSETPSSSIVTPFGRVAVSFCGRATAGSVHVPAGWVAGAAVGSGQADGRQRHERAGEGHHRRELGPRAGRPAAAVGVQHGEQAAFELRRAGHADGGQAQAAAGGARLWAIERRWPAYSDGRAAAAGEDQVVAGPLLLREHPPGGEPRERVVPVRAPRRPARAVA